MSALENRPKEPQAHWTDELKETLGVGYKNLRLQASAVLAVALLTLGSFIGLAHYQAPLYAYLVASVTGLVFGLLAKRKRWHETKGSG